MSGWDDDPIEAQAGVLSPAGDDAGGWDAEPAAASAVKLGQKPAPREIRQALLALPTLAGARIDASEVEKLSAPTIQVLLAAFREAREEAPMAVISPSFVFSLAFETYGLGGDQEPFTVEYS